MMYGSEHIGEHQAQWRQNVSSIAVESRTRVSPARRFSVSSLVIASPNDTPTVVLLMWRTFTS